MGDVLTDEDLKSEEYKKQERIKKEREKAAKAISEEEKKNDKVNLSYLDPVSTTKFSGFVRGPEAMRRSLERLAGLSGVLMVAGIMVDLPSRFVDLSGLGMGPAMMLGMIAGIGAGMTWLALMLAAFTTGAAIVCRKKYGADVRIPLRMALTVLVITGVYELIFLLVGR